MGTDRRWDSGPFDIVGDVHGCCDELVALLRQLGYVETAGTWKHPQARRLIFLGDLVDRGPQVVEVLELVIAVVSADGGLCLMGNHEAKLDRALRGNDVRLTNGLSESLAQLSRCTPVFIESVQSFIGSLKYHYVLDRGRLVVAHAGLPEAYHGEDSKTARRLAVYGETTAAADQAGYPNRKLWASDYSGVAAVVYGHTPVRTASWTNNTINVDTGCVFGSALSALRWPERQLVSVSASAVHYPRERPFD